MTKKIFKTKKIFNHIRLHKQHYATWIFWSFAVIKMIALFAGLFWAIAFIGNNQVSAAYETFCADNSWSLDIPVAECEALVSLYNTNNWSSWYNNTNWWTSTTICSSWYGITCTPGIVKHVFQIDLSSNNLSWTISSLIGLPNLSSLYLAWNNITSISMIGAISLQDIHLEHNKLTSIPNLAGLPLNYLHLEYNNITSIPTNVFAGLSSLQAMYLDHNNITAIPSDAFSGLSASFNMLGYDALYLNNNNISSIAPNAFRKGLSSVYRVDLSNNQLTTLWSGTFAGRSQLNNVTASYNLLTSISDYAFAGTNVKTLNFAYNTTLGSLPNFNGITPWYLYFMSCWLTDISTLSGLSSIKSLYLDSNSLTSIPNLTASTTMTILSIANNLLTAIPNLSGLSSLTQLYIQNNYIESIANIVGIGLSNLQYFYMDSNYITTIPENFTTMTSLNVGGWVLMNNNKICTGGMSPWLITFLNTLPGNSTWQSTQDTSLCNLTRTGSFSINNAATETDTGAITLTMDAPGTTNMRFSNTGANWPRTTWETYSPTKAWILTPWYGTKTVRAQFDTDSNTSTVEWATSYSIEYVGVVSRCTGAWSGSDVTLCIEPIGLGYCEYGNSLDLGITWYSAAGRDITSAFNTTSGNAAWFCNDLQGANPRTLSIQSSDLLNVSTNDPGQTISASNIYIKNPSATKIEWVCTANAGSSLNQRTSIDVSTIILGKSNSIGEVCKVETSSLDFKVAIPAYQSLGQYSGTLTITVPNL